MHLKSFLPFLALIFISNILSAQYNYEPSIENPFGLPNPEAPAEIMDWAPLIGICDCNSTARNTDQSWAESQKMTWTFKYILNGNGVQDETLKEDGSNSGSIRQYIADSSKWFVHYYSSKGPTPVLRAWSGNKQDTAIILYNEQKAPNGTEGYYKIHFYDINDEGFEWLGEWVNTAETFSYPTWKISCKKRISTSVEGEKIAILKAVEDFSKAFVDLNYDAMANAYTEDGKIFPINDTIYSGREEIRKFWIMPDGVSMKEHKISPQEITVLGNTAYDYSLYEGVSKNATGEVNPFKGKSMIIWKKVDGKWLMHYDFWNRR